jgi:hypothetical protein
VTKAELQAAYDDLCQVLDEIGAVLESNASDRAKLRLIEQQVFQEDDQADEGDEPADEEDE